MLEFGSHNIRFCDRIEICVEWRRRLRDSESPANICWWQLHKLCQENRGVSVGWQTPAAHVCLNWLWYYNFNFRVKGLWIHGV